LGRVAPPSSENALQTIAPPADGETIWNACGAASLTQRATTPSNRSASNVASLFQSDLDMDRSPLHLSQQHGSRNRRSVEGWRYNPRKTASQAAE
jgi:hypothetical protein